MVDLDLLPTPDRVPLTSGQDREATVHEDMAFFVDAHRNAVCNDNDSEDDPIEEYVAQIPVADQGNLADHLKPGTSHPNEARLDRELLPTDGPAVHKKHGILPMCEHKESLRTTHFKCKEIEASVRVEIHRKYWQKSIQARRDFVASNVTCRNRTKVSRNEPQRDIKRWNTYKIAEQIVCKTFFLGTLGLTSDSIIRSVFGNLNEDEYSHNTGAPQDRRGRHEPRNKFPDTYKEEITTFIESFNPCVSHYRLEHAPNRRYFSSDLSKTVLFNLWTEQQVQNSTAKLCSRTYFDTIFDSLNISFSRSSNDKCSICEAHRNKGDHECQGESCQAFIDHKNRSKIAREEMLADSHRAKTDNIKVISVDMEKVLQMPKLNVKEAFFSRKLNLFNETFADVFSGGMAYCFLWHEEEAGRKACDIASTYEEFILRYCRDFEEIIFYADNCNAQNKNRFLLSALLKTVNDNRISAGTITMKFLEVGHTYMSADSVHASISQKMKLSENLYDFDDFASVIEKSRKKMQVITLSHADMRIYDSKDILARIVGLSQFRVIQVRRGSLNVFAKKDYRDDFKEISLLKKQVERNFLGNQVVRQSDRRGVSCEKHKDLLNLTKVMPENRRQFYTNMMVNTNAEDLSVDRDIDF